LKSEGEISLEYRKTITLKDGRICVLRNATEQDGEAVLNNFILTHEQTDNLLSYTDENDITPEEEGQFLKEKTESSTGVEILAEVDGIVAGLAGIAAMGNKYKICHRADFGISVDQAYWGLGIGRALTEACIECAKLAGYEQMELNVIAENKRAVKMYEKAGFTEFGRNPRGFRSRLSGYQELVYMRLELQ
jgi:ribosomal protein S18 acetylase RimI-like enzyme